MSSVSLTLRQTSTTQPSDQGSLYALTSRVESAIGIDKSVFVFRTSNQAFSHYATSADLVGLPDTRQAAEAAGLGFYRQSQLTRAWPTLKEMDGDLTLTRARIRALVDDVAGALTRSVVNETVTIEAG